MKQHVQVLTSCFGPLFCLLRLYYWKFFSGQSCTVNTSPDYKISSHKCNKLFNELSFTKLKKIWKPWFGTLHKMRFRSNNFKLLLHSYYSVLSPIWEMEIIKPMLSLQLDCKSHCSHQLWSGKTEIKSTKQDAWDKNCEVSLVYSIINQQQEFFDSLTKIRKAFTLSSYYSVCCSHTSDIGIPLKLVRSWKSGALLRPTGFDSSV